MLSPVQQIILTCLLGPEDKTAFTKFQKREYDMQHVLTEEQRLRKNAKSLERYHNFSDDERKQYSEGGKNWTIANKDRVKELRLIRYSKNPKKFLESTRNWKRDFPEDAAASAKKTRIKRHSKALDAQNNRYAVNASYRMGKILRSRLYIALKRGGAKKSASAFKLLGCPLVWLEVHLESLFKPGMTWQNHGPVWHIDHIKPCAKFDLADPEQQKACFHWTNLQPLFAEENWSKNDTYNV